MKKILVKMCCIIMIGLFIGVSIFKCVHFFQHNDSKFVVEDNDYEGVFPLSIHLD